MTQNFASFPTTRLRRNRKEPWLRELVAENSLCTSDLIMPFFVIDGNNKKENIESMPQMYRFSVDLLIKEVKECKQLGIKAIMLFASIDQTLKNKNGSETTRSSKSFCEHPDQRSLTAKKQKNGRPSVENPKKDR